MLDKFTIRNIFAPKKMLSTSKSIINTFTVPKSEKITINKHTASLVLQSIDNFFIETWRTAESITIPRQKKYSKIQSSDAIGLFPFLWNEAHTWYNKVIVFGAYCDLLQYLMQRNKSKEIISSVLNNIKIIYFQNPAEIRPLLNMCTPIVESALQCISSRHESANSYFSTFDDTNIPVDASTHTIYFKEMLAKQPFYTSRKFLAFWLAWLWLIGYFINQWENATASNLPSRWPIVDNIEYPRNTDVEDVTHSNKPQSIPKNGPLYNHHATWISILPVKNQEEFHVVSLQTQVWGTYNSNNDYSTISTTVSESHLKIDREITKNQLYKIISLLRKNKKYNMNDVTFWLADEIRVEDLPEGVAWLFKNWSDNPTDKDIYLDTDLVSWWTQLDQEWVLIHEFIHSMIWTSPSTLRNEWMTEALTHRSFYDSRHIDLFNFNDPYGPHVLDFIMINNVYWSWYDWFEHFGLELVYNYKDLSTPVVNPEYASWLAYILSSNPESVINPVVIAFFTWWLDGIAQAKKHFLCTPWTVKWFETVKNMYEKSEFYAIEQNNSLTDIEKVQRAIDYFEANKWHLSATSPHDELPWNKVNVGFDGSNRPWNGTSLWANEEAETWEWNWKWLWKQQDKWWDKESQKPSSEEDSREWDTSRWEFARELALSVVVDGADGKIWIRLDEERYDRYYWKIDPRYFSQKVGNTLKNRIEQELTKNRNTEITSEEKAIIDNIFHQNFKSHIHSLAELFEHTMKSDQTYQYRAQNSLDFLDESDPKSLQKTSERVVGEFLQTIDIPWLILEQDNIYDIIDVIAQQNKKWWILSEEFLDACFEDELNTYVNEFDVVGSVPFFKEKYLSTDDAAHYLATQYSALVDATTDVKYTIEKNESTLQRIKQLIKEKNTGLIDAVKIVLIEQNKEKIKSKVKQSPFYLEAIHRYIDPLSKDQNYVLKHTYDALDFVDKNKTPIFYVINTLLLLIFLTYIRSWAKSKETIKHALLKKYSWRADKENIFPIHDYISKKEIEYTMSPVSKKLRILNAVLLAVFFLWYLSTNMEWYKSSIFQKHIERYKRDNPIRKRTPHTYQNLLLLDNPQNSVTEIKLTIAKSYTSEHETSIYESLYSWSFPFHPHLNYGNQEITLPSQVIKQITNLYPLNKKVSEQQIVITHRSVQNIIWSNLSEQEQEKWSTKWLWWAVFLAVWSLASVLLFAYNKAIYLKKAQKFRKEIWKLISLPWLHSVNEREIDLILKNDDNINDLLWKRIEYQLWGLTTIREPIDIKSLLSSVSVPWEVSDRFPFVTLLKNACSRFDRETLWKIAYKHLWEDKIENIEEYTHMIVNYHRGKLLPSLWNKWLLTIHNKNHSNESHSIVHNTVKLNFIEQYLPRIILAKVKWRSIETYINGLPFSEKVAYFTNVKLIKDWLPSNKEDGEIQSNWFDINGIMTPQISPSPADSLINDPYTLKIWW